MLGASSLSTFSKDGGIDGVDGSLLDLGCWLWLSVVVVIGGLAANTVIATLEGNPVLTICRWDRLSHFSHLPTPSSSPVTLCLNTNIRRGASPAANFVNGAVVRFSPFPPTMEWSCFGWINCPICFMISGLSIAFLPTLGSCGLILFRISSQPFSEALSLIPWFPLPQILRRFSGGVTNSLLAFGVAVDLCDNRGFFTGGSVSSIA